MLSNCTSDSRRCAEVAKTSELQNFFFDGFGPRQSAADMDGMKATMLPIIQDGLLILLRRY